MPQVMAQEESKLGEEPQAEARAPVAKPGKKGLFLGGGLVSLIGLAWALSLVAVPQKHEVVRHEIAGPFFANISPTAGFQVNLAGKGGKHYLAMNLKAEVDAFEESYATERASEPLYQAKLTDAVLRVASRKSKAELDDTVGKDVFREELRVALDPVLFPIHVGDEERADARHTESGLRAGASMDRATMRGIFWEHTLEVDAAKKILRLDAGPDVPFTGEETDLLVEDERGRSLYVDVTGLRPDFHGKVQTGVLGRVRNVYFSSFLTQ